MGPRSLHWFALAAVVSSALAATACGGGASGGDLQTAGGEAHRIPGYDVSFELPPTWDAVDYRSSGDELDRFDADHPRLVGLTDGLRVEGTGQRLAAALGEGDVRLLVSVREVGDDYTLAGHIRESLRSLETDAQGLGISIDGPGDELADVAGGEAWRIRWSYDGDLGRIRLVQYTLVREAQLYVFTYSTLTPWEEVAEVFETSARSIRIGPAPAAPSATGSTGQIAFQRETDGRTDIFVLEPDGSASRLTRTGQDFLPVWSPDGARIAFTSTRDGREEVYVMNADGSGQRRLTRSPNGAVATAWSPDGRRIMFTRGGPNDSLDIYTMSADGGDVERMTRDPSRGMLDGSSTDGSWSPDGSQIVFWSNSDFDSGIFVMDADGSDVRALTPGFETAWGPDWSPDGKSIVFVGTKDGPDDLPKIYRMSADGSDVELLAEVTGYWVDEPDWSPDGASIAFFSDGLGPGMVWTMAADGTRQQPVVREGDAHAPSWRPGRG